MGRDTKEYRSAERYCADDKITGRKRRSEREARAESVRLRAGEAEPGSVRRSGKEAEPESVRRRAGEAEPERERRRAGEAEPERERRRAGEAEPERERRSAGKAGAGKERRMAGENRGNSKRSVRDDRREESIRRQNRRSAQARHLSEKEKARRREAHRRKVLAARACLGAALLALIVLLAAGIVSLVKNIREGNRALPVVSLENVADMPEPIIKEDFLPFNEYSRPGTELPAVKKLFVHYTANPGTTAQQNRDYFAGLSQSRETSASSHYVIGYNGEIIQCLPLKEIGYAVKGRNFDSLSIECCYLDESGVFTAETYESLLKLTAWLLQEYHLTTRDVWRHYDEGGKNCPKYYVEHEEEWEQFQRDLYQYIEEQNEKAQVQ